MIGSIVGDTVGSVYEYNNIKTKKFPLFSNDVDYTDDSALTIATADWLLHGGKVEIILVPSSASKPQNLKTCNLSTCEN